MPLTVLGGWAAQSTDMRRSIPEVVEMGTERVNVEIKWQLRRQRETAQGDWGFVRRMEQAAWTSQRSPQ